MWQTLPIGRRLNTESPVLEEDRAVGGVEAAGSGGDGHFGDDLDAGEVALDGEAGGFLAFFAVVIPGGVGVEAGAGLGDGAAHERGELAEDDGDGRVGADFVGLDFGEGLREGAGQGVEVAGAIAAMERQVVELGGGFHI